jgi:hypothetical protein
MGFGADDGSSSGASGDSTGGANDSGSDIPAGNPDSGGNLATDNPENNVPNTYVPTPSSSGGGSTTPTAPQPTPSTTNALAVNSSGLTGGQLLLIALGVAAAGGGVWYLAHRHKQNKVRVVRLRK